MTEQPEETIEKSIEQTSRNYIDSTDEQISSFIESQELKPREPPESLYKRLRELEEIYKWNERLAVGYLFSSFTGSTGFLMTETGERMLQAPADTPEYGGLMAGFLTITGTWIYTAEKGKRLKNKITDERDKKNACLNNFRILDNNESDEIAELLEDTSYVSLSLEDGTYDELRGDEASNLYKELVNPARETGFSGRAQVLNVRETENSDSDSLEDWTYELHLYDHGEHSLILTGNDQNAEQYKDKGDKLVDHWDEFSEYLEEEIGSFSRVSIARELSAGFAPW